MGAGVAGGGGAFPAVAIPSALAMSVGLTVASVVAEEESEEGLEEEGYGGEKEEVGVGEEGAEEEEEEEEGGRGVAGPRKLPTVHGKSLGDRDALPKAPSQGRECPLWSRKKQGRPSLRQEP